MKKLGGWIMKKLIILIILMINIVSCALLDAELYEEVKREREERDRTCYQDYNGNYFCKDTK